MRTFKASAMPKLQRLRSLESRILGLEPMRIPFSAGENTLWHEVIDVQTNMPIRRTSKYSNGARHCLTSLVISNKSLYPPNLTLGKSVFSSDESSGSLGGMLCSRMFLSSCHSGSKKHRVR